MHDMPVSAAAVAVSALLEVGATWHGVVKVDGLIHEPGGYHPYTATITLQLRESGPVSGTDGRRVLISDGSVNDVQTSVHQTGGPLLCSGIG